MMKISFGMQININVFFKLVVSFSEMLSILVCAARHAQSTENKKLALPLQYLQKNVGNEVDYFVWRYRQKFSSSW